MNVVPIDPEMGTLTTLSQMGKFALVAILYANFILVALSWGYNTFYGILNGAHSVINLRVKLTSPTPQSNFYQFAKLNKFKGYHQLL